MKSNYLFPHWLKKIGWIVFIPVFIFFIFCLFNSEIYKEPFYQEMCFHVFAIVDNTYLDRDTQFFKLVENCVGDELIFCLLVVSGILVGFSKVKVEDEMVSKIRLESLVWATYINYAIFLVSTIFVYGPAFLDALYINIFSLLLVFIIRFHWKLYQYNKIYSDEE